MYIDQTRYEAFWRNPERFRLTYICNLVPKGLAYGLARGTALHTIAEEKANGLNDEQINLILTGQCPNSRGEMIEPLSEEAINMAWLLWNALANHPSSADIQIVKTEQEFMYQIPNSPHFMVGRVDRIIMRGGQLWAGELKTANPRARFDDFLNEWTQKKQADFEIIGAKSLGYDVEGVYVQQVVEGQPPKVWETEERRSEHRLQVTMLNVHQTCEIIEMLKTVFGANVPWPHLPYLWPCNKPGKCEYETICGQCSENWLPSDLAPFKQREEHLECLRKLQHEGAQAA